MDEKKSKTQKTRERLDRARQAGEIGKMIAPDKVDRYIDRGTQAIDAAEAGITLFQRLKGIFSKKK